MGTRSLTHIINDDWGTAEHLCTIYRQYDGYPEGHGRDLAEFITSRRFVNGIGDDPTGVFNGAGCFAAALVAHLKTEGDGKIEAGGVYLHNPDIKDTEEFNYTVTIAKTEVSLKVVEPFGPVLFEGTPNEFLELIAEEDK